MLVAATGANFISVSASDSVSISCSRHSGRWTHGLFSCMNFHCSYLPILTGLVGPWPSLKRDLNTMVEEQGSSLQDGSRRESSVSAGRQGRNLTR